MPSILNGLFSGRSGLSAFGVAIAVVGDNIANASTLGFKQSRAEFQDLLAGGQTSGKQVGSGSSNSAVTPIFTQGTLEFTSRPLDLAIDGNGFFAVSDSGARYYTRAGNFRVDESGNIVNQNGLQVLGFPAGGSGTLEGININTVSQDSVATTAVTVSGNVDASAATIAAASIPTVSNAGATTGLTTTTYADLNAVSEFSTVVDITDSLGAFHTLTFFFFHTGSNAYTVRGYVNSEDVDTTGSATGLPRLIVDGATTPNGNISLAFANGDGTRTNTPAAGSSDLTAIIPWNNGSVANGTIDISFDPFTQFSSSSNISGITQDGQGIGTVTSVSIEGDGQIFAVLDNGQTAVIGSIGLVNFANPEGLTRVGNQLLQQSTESGEPVVGLPDTGTFGTLSSGSVELSTVDIANEFVKLITLQRGFQANSRVITIINQLLGEIQQLV